VVVLKANISALNSIRAEIADQYEFMKRGVTCALLGLLKTTLAAVFWISCRGLTLHAREHYNSPVWIEQELGQGVVWHALMEWV